MGSFLNGLFRYAFPILKKSAVAIGRELLDVSSNVLNDVANDDGTTISNALKNHGMTGVNNLRKKAISKMSGHGIHRSLLKPKKKRQSIIKSRKRNTSKVSKKSKPKKPTKTKKTKSKSQAVYGYF